MPANEAETALVNALGMKCPWPALRAARAMRTARTVLVDADDPVAPSELSALAHQQGWTFATLGDHRFSLHRGG